MNHPQQAAAAACFHTGAHGGTRDSGPVTRRPSDFLKHRGDSEHVPRADTHVSGSRSGPPSTSRQSPWHPRLFPGLRECAG